MPAERPAQDDGFGDLELLKDFNGRFGIAGHRVGALGVRGVGGFAVAGEVEGEHAAGGGDVALGDGAEDGTTGGVTVDEEEGGKGAGAHGAESEAAMTGFNVDDLVLVGHVCDSGALV